MFSKKMTKALMISTVLVIGIASLAFARGGRGYGGDGACDDCPGAGPGMRMGGGHGMMGGGPGHWGYGRGSNLTDEQKAKIDAAREKFWTDTEALRIQKRDKFFALQDEMNKKAPDSAKVAQLQKELSQVEAEFDQKAVQHHLEMRQLLPEGAYGPGSGRGFGGRCIR